MKSDPSKPALRAWSDEIDALLAGQLRRIRGRFLLHGSGWVVAAAAATVLVYFLLDVGLQLPTIVRVLVTAAIAVYLAVGVRRRLVYPLLVPFAHSDVAIAIERRFPELHERLITALQLKDSLSPDAEDGALRSQSAAMVERVVADAAATARTIPAESILSARRTVRVWSVGGAVALALLTSVLVEPSQFGVFLQRAVGFDVEYPRRTHLFVELPEDEEGYKIAKGDGRIDVTLAAGADLPVLVRAEGVVPREVGLAIRGGRGLPATVSMGQRPGDRFRHVFRRVQGEFSFHAQGGDDPRGDVEVFVRTVHPPLVGTIDAELQFPAYTGLAPERRSGGAVEALIGTQVRLLVTATAPVQTATARFLDSGLELTLEPTRLADDSGAGVAFAAGFAVTASDRYEVHLTNAEGLSNPRPGTYPVVALEDHAPVGRVLLPQGDDITVVLPTARIAVRVDAHDDFGLADVSVRASTGREENASTTALLPPSTEAPLREAVLTELLDVAALEPGDGPRQGDTVGLAVSLRDNRAPEAGTTDLPKRQVHVVDPVELARRISSHFRRVRDQVEKTLDQARQQRDSLEALLEDVPEPTAGRDPRLVTLQVGQSRVNGAMRRVREDLMQAYDIHLFNGLEGADSIQAPRVQELYVAFHRANPVAEPFVPAFYRLVGEEQKAGRIGRMEKALDPILAMALLGDAIVEDTGRRAAETLDASGIAPSKDALREKLTATRTVQDGVVTQLETLLAQLDQWNEFQDVVQQARALRDAQKDIEFRTRTLGEGGEEKRR